MKSFFNTWLARDRLQVGLPCVAWGVHLTTVSLHCLLFVSSPPQHNNINIQNFINQASCRLLSHNACFVLQTTSCFVLPKLKCCRLWQKWMLVLCGVNICYRMGSSFECKITFYNGRFGFETQISFLFLFAANLTHQRTKNPADILRCGGTDNTTNILIDKWTFYLLCQHNGDALQRDLCKSVFKVIADLVW